MNQKDLLGELKIERRHREEHDDTTGRWPWAIGAIAIVVLLVGGAWWLWPARAVEVETVTAIAPSAAAGSGAVLQATGYVTARRQTTASAQIIGTLTEVLIEEGDHVEKGQVLARLDDSSQLARLHAAKASANAAQAQVAQLRAELDQARRDRERAVDLAGRGLVSRQTAEQARTRVEILAAQFKAQQAQAEAADAQVGIAQVNYDYTVVRAPFAGVITQKTAQVGEIISPSAAGGGFTRTGVGTIVDMDSLEIEVDVNEAYIARVSAGMPAVAVLDAYPDWEISAHVIAIVPTADRAKATIKVRVALETDDPRVVPNMGVRVSFLEPETESAASAPPPDGVLVPASAVLERDGARVVFAVEDGKARLRRVSISERKYGDLVLVTDGIAGGAEVIVEPPAAIVDGAAVATGESDETS